MLAKKKVEKNLASFVNAINMQTSTESNKAGSETKAHLERMRQNTVKPARSFKMPYPITASCYKSMTEENQYLALGLLDGAIVVLDLALGMEKFFIEKHPGAVTSLAFYEDKVLISGSVDGRVNLCDLDSEN
jgi:WD40 repeat protein